MVKLGSLVIHVDDAYRAAAFWRQALGYEPLRGSPDCARIAPKDGKEPHLAFDENRADDGEVWKVDMWLFGHDHPGPRSIDLVGAMERALTDETAERS